ncbi:MAG TPA: methyltransferase domain-containing protein [Candidatus Moranbacteria bacterium]|nr:methyltransferase domain-containing protein [Candidatus Moranbacteria bacterium]
MTFDKSTNYAVKFLNPEEIISGLEILPGMRVAHFGCGTGFFTFPVAKKIGEGGVVYALDILEAKVEAVRSQAKIMGLDNIDARRVNLEEEKGTKLGKESIDWVLIVNMLYQSQKKLEVFMEAERILKKGGCILFIDWEELDRSLGPEIKNRVSKDELSDIIQKNKLAILKKIKVSSFHFGWIITK